MSVWLVPSISGALVASLVLAGVYIYLFQINGQQHIAQWTAAWLLYALRSVLMLLAALKPEHEWAAEGLARWADVGSCLLLLAGAETFFRQRPVNPGWIAVGVAAVLWYSTAPAAGMSFLWQNVPVFFLQAGIFLWTGRMFLTAGPAGERTTAHIIVGAGFILWGLHKADFPFLRGVPDLAPAGFMLSGALSLLVAVGTILVYYERSERRLRENENRYRARFIETHAVELLIDPRNGAIVDANPAAAAFYGYTIEELCSRRITDINVMSPEALAAEVELARTGRRNYFLFRHRLASGEQRDVEVYASPIPFEDRTLLFSIIHDITERRRAEEGLRKLSRAVEQSPVSVIITDLAGTIEYVNPHFEATTGYTADEVIGRNPRLLRPGHTTPTEYDGSAEYEELWRTIGSGGIWRGEFHNRRKDGTMFWEAASISAVRDEKGAVTHYIAVKEDITERKQTEAELVAAKQMAEAANRAKSTFLANMSHELRTPLNAILGFSEVMKGQIFGPIGDARYRAYAADIHRSGMHLLDLINAILDLAKLEAGRFELREEVLAVERVIGDCLGMVQGQAAAAGVQVAAAPDAAGLPALRADAQALTEILLNLLSNAIKFTPAGGQVTVAVSVDAEGWLVLAVTDTGIGIAPADMATALAPFGQVDSRLSRRHAGTGLGLPLTRRLVAQHGGILDLTSTVGAGTTVTVRFPRERVLP